MIPEALRPTMEVRLSNTIKRSFRIAIEKRFVEDSFPTYERPSVREMEEAIELSLNNEPLPMDLEAKLSREKPIEALNRFCEERGLYWEYNPINDTYVFGLETFKDGL
jgi:hypothetical protein